MRHRRQERLVGDGRHSHHAAHARSVITRSSCSRSIAAANVYAKLGVERVVAELRGIGDLGFELVDPAWLGQREPDECGHAGELECLVTDAPHQDAPRAFTPHHIVGRA